jgi:hypothetical protein
MRSSLGFLLSALMLAACGVVGGAPTPTPTAPSAAGYAGWPPSVRTELIPIPVSTELVVGENRLLVNLIDSANEPLASPERPVKLNLFNLSADPETPAQTVDATYMPTVEDAPGLYRADVTFSIAGEWGLEAVATEADGSTRTGRMVFPVRESGTTPRIGEPARSFDSPTAASAADIVQISTDNDPDPDFYRQSVAGALDGGDPFVLVFATPAFCRSVTCGPTLDLVKSVAADYKDGLTFIHVEPYRLKAVDGQLQPELSDQNLPIPVDAVNQWGLPTEPYVFVVDAQGNVAAKFEGIASEEELRGAFDAVST